MQLEREVKLAIMIILPTIYFEVSAQCATGDVRLVGGSIPNEGRVEVCLFSQWGTVCDDDWGDDDAKVVCRQLGYGTNEAEAFTRAHFGRGDGQIVLDNVQCNPNEHRYLLDCGANNQAIDCHHGEDAGVRCLATYQPRVTKITVTTLNGPSSDFVTALITWEIQNITAVEELIMYELECLVEGHRMAISVSNQTTFTYLGGLLRSKSSYNCCVSEVYDLYTTKGACIVIKIPTRVMQTILTTSTDSMLASLALQTSNSTSTIGGVLGFIIIILLILLALLVIPLVCLLRPKLRKKVIPTKISHIVDTNSSTLPVQSNISYLTAPSRSRSTNDGAYEEARATEQGVPSTSNPNYSSFGPAYETLSDGGSRRQPARHEERNNVTVPISERYEFAEIHADTDHRARNEESHITNDYEIPRENVENEEYSHLQH